MTAPENQEMHPCARCAGMQKTCCQRAEILVTNGDLVRIAQHTGKLDVSEYRAPADPTYLDDDADDPDWKRLTVRPDGTRRVLKRKPSGDCTFLGSAGCVLPQEVRPIVCRLYPWTFTHHGLKEEDSEYCPINKLDPAGKHGGSMLRVLKMNPADGQRWHKMLYHELKTGSESP